MQAGVAHPRQCAVVVQAGVGMQLQSIEQHTQPLLQHSHCCRCFYAAGRWGINGASCSIAGRAAWPQQQAQPVPQQGRAAPSTRTCTEPQQQRRRQAKLGRSKKEEGGGLVLRHCRSQAQVLGRQHTLQCQQAHLMIWLRDRVMSTRLRLLRDMLAARNSPGGHSIVLSPSSRQPMHRRQDNGQNLPHRLPQDPSTAAPEKACAC